MLDLQHNLCWQCIVYGKTSNTTYVWKCVVYGRTSHTPCLTPNATCLKFVVYGKTHHNREMFSWQPHMPINSLRYSPRNPPWHVGGKTCRVGCFNIHNTLSNTFCVAGKTCCVGVFNLHNTTLIYSESLCQKQSTYLPSIKLSSRLLVTSCSQIFHCHYTQLMLHQTNSSVKFRSEERHDDSRMGWCTGDVSSISRSNGFLLYMVRTYHQPFVKLTMDGLYSPHSVMNYIFQLTAREATYPNTVLIKYVKAINFFLEKREEISIHFLFSLPLSHLQTKLPRQLPVLVPMLSLSKTSLHTKSSHRNVYTNQYVCSSYNCLLQKYTLKHPTKSPVYGLVPLHPDKMQWIPCINC